MGVNINYIDYGNKDGNALVLLHGWGQNIDMMKPIGDKFLKNYRVIIIDLPGHGKSNEPTNVLTVYDYSLMIHELLKELKVKNPTIIGHSFGGKIALVYARKYDIKKLICLASPYKKGIEKLSFKTKVLKVAKKIPILNKLEGFAKRRIGSTDYKEASDMMRKIMVESINLDITEDVKKISVPTLLIWGTLDNAVSIEDAYSLEKLIPDSGLVVYEGATHYAYLERLGQTIKVIESFLGD